MFLDTKIKNSVLLTSELYARWKLFKINMQGICKENICYVTGLRAHRTTSRYYAISYQDGVVVASIFWFLHFFLYVKILRFILMIFIAFHRIFTIMGTFTIFHCHHHTFEQKANEKKLQTIYPIQKKEEAKLAWRR